MMERIVSRNRTKTVRRGRKEKGLPDAHRWRVMAVALAALVLATRLGPAAAQTLSVNPAAISFAADQTAGSERRPAAYEDPNEAEAPAQRNPFAPSRRSVALVAGGAGAGTRFRANNASSKLPRLKLRGLVQGDSGSEVTALLEINAVGVYVVHKGDIIGLPMGGNDNVIKVNEITDLSIVVEVGSLGQLVIVR